ncbi:uncharacterized protein LOC144378470 [Ictidomys tridecemlineatus]
MSCRAHPRSRPESRAPTRPGGRQELGLLQSSPPGSRPGVLAFCGLSVCSAALPSGLLCCVGDSRPAPGSGVTAPGLSFHGDFLPLHPCGLRVPVSTALSLGVWSGLETADLGHWRVLSIHFGGFHSGRGRGRKQEGDSRQGGLGPVSTLGSRGETACHGAVPHTRRSPEPTVPPGAANAPVDPATKEAPGVHQPTAESEPRPRVWCPAALQEAPGPLSQVLGKPARPRAPSTEDPSPTTWSLWFWEESVTNRAAGQGPSTWPSRRAPFPSTPTTLPAASLSTLNWLLGALCPLSAPKPPQRALSRPRNPLLNQQRR